MSRNTIIILAVIVVAAVVAAFLWSPAGRNMLGGTYGSAGTTTVKTP